MAAKKKAPAKKAAAKKSPRKSPRKSPPGQKKPVKQRGRAKSVPVAPEDRPLTPKQAAFVRWYTSEICNCNGVEAARRAGYRGSYNTLAVAAHDNLKKPNIRKAVDQAIKQALDGADCTIEGTLRDLRQVYLMAIEDKQFSAAKGAAELRGKYLKMFTERIEHVETIDDVSLEQLVDLVREIAGANNIDIAKLIAGDGADGGAVSAAPGNKATH